MTKQVEIYYLLDENANTFYWTLEEEDHPHDLIFVGSSLNPNKRMAIAAFVKGTPREFGYKLKELI